LSGCRSTEPETTGAVPQHESASSDGNRISNRLPQKQIRTGRNSGLRENTSSSRVFQHQRLVFNSYARFALTRQELNAHGRLLLPYVAKQFVFAIRKRKDRVI